MVKDLLLERARIYNPRGAINAPGIFKKGSSGVLNMNDLGQQVFHNLFEKLKNNYWTKDSVNMQDDVKVFPTLSQEEQDAYLRANVQLATLDSVQTPSILALMDYVYSPELRLALALQAQQEAIHTEAYPYMMSSITSLQRQQEYYELTLEGKIEEKTEYVIEAYERFFDNPTVQNLFDFLVYCIVLEGIFFYAGFAYFYSLAKDNLMTKSATMISYIQRDEVQHGYLVANVYNLALKEFPEMDTQEQKERTQEIIRKACELEKEWSHELFGGLNRIDMHEFDLYIEYLGNKRLNQIDIDPIYEEVDNPMPWISVYSDEYLDSTKTDFFEDTNRTYEQVSEDNGFGEL